MDENQQLRPAATEPIPPLWEMRLRSIWGRAVEVVEHLNPTQRRYGALAAAIVVIIAGGLIWYASRPDLRVLYAGLDPADAREIASGLGAAGVSFDLSPDGATIRVPSDMVDKARLAATAKGGPKSGRMGFEIFDKPNWIGSEFDEKVNYQRALEGELEHTIASMGAVESARVHLTMAHDSLFTDQQRGAKASVVLKLKHRSLSEEEAESVRNLVASAVDSLSPDQVVLADADGHAVLGKKTASAEAEAHEQALAEKLIETLEPVAGVGNVRASVNVDYETGTTEETDESYDPASVVTLSMQKSQQTATPSPAPAGVPGTASNAPNAQPPLFPSKAATVESSTEENGTYGASKKTRRMAQGSGKVRRVTAAILVNDRLAGEPKHASWKSRDPEELKRLTVLAQAAIGYDAARGDQISVENIAFEGNNGSPLPGVAERLLKGAMQSEALLKYATILAAMLGLILFVLRPIAAKTHARPAPALGAGAVRPMERAEGALPASQGIEPALDAQKLRAQSLHDGVVESINGDPALSARLLHSWIHAE